VTLGEERGVLEHFADEGRERVSGFLSLLQALVLGPEREDVARQAVSSGFRLCRTIREGCSSLGLAHLTAPTEALEVLLERIRFGGALFTPQCLALATECCTFLDQGLLLVVQEHSDQRLAASADALSAAILEAAHADDASGVSGEVADVATSRHGELFLQDCEQALATIEQECVLWDFIAVDHRRVADLCRLLHSLQQKCARQGWEGFARLCMALEATLHRYLHGEFFQTEYPERVFLRAVDAMRAAQAGASLDKKPGVAGLEHHLAAVQGLIRQPIGELLIEAGLVDARTVDQALAAQRSLLVAEPRRLGEMLVAMGEVTEQQVLHILQTQQGERLSGAPADAVLADGLPVAPASRSLLPAPSQKISVDGRKLARLIAVVKRMTAVPSPAALQPLIAEAHTLALACNREAVASFLRSLQRFVHELADRHQKRVHFSVHGEEALVCHGLDMAVLAEMLIPLFRNGVVHGLEPVAERMRLGKRKSGRLSLTALQQGEEIWVSVEDDGRGFDLTTCAAPNVAPDGPAISAQPRDSLEITPGLLSNPPAGTGEAQAAESGDAGLTVVQARLQSMRGTMEMWSRPGCGARITLRVPRED